MARPVLLTVPQAPAVPGSGGPKRLVSRSLCWDNSFCEAVSPGRCGCSCPAPAVLPSPCSAEPWELGEAEGAAPVCGSAMPGQGGFGPGLAPARGRMRPVGQAGTVRQPLELSLPVPSASPGAPALGERLAAAPVLRGGGPVLGMGVSLAPFDSAASRHPQQLPDPPFPQRDPHSPGAAMGAWCMASPSLASLTLVSSSLVSPSLVSTALVSLCLVFLSLASPSWCPSLCCPHPGFPACRIPIPGVPVPGVSILMSPSPRGSVGAGPMAGGQWVRGSAD